MIDEAFKNLSFKENDPKLIFLETMNHVKITIDQDKDKVAQLYFHDNNMAKLLTEMHLYELSMPGGVSVTEKIVNPVFSEY